MINIVLYLVFILIQNSGSVVNVEKSKNELIKTLLSAPANKLAVKEDFLPQINAEIYQNNKVLNVQNALSNSRKVELKNNKKLFNKKRLLKKKLKRNAIKNSLKVKSTPRWIYVTNTPVYEEMENFRFSAMSTTPKAKEVNANAILTLTNFSRSITNLEDDKYITKSSKIDVFVNNDALPAIVEENGT